MTSSKAKDLYDSIGNEIFASIIAALKADKANMVVTHTPTYFRCILADGSEIVFDGGFASYSVDCPQPIPEIKVEVEDIAKGLNQALGATENRAVVLDDSDQVIPKN